MDCDYYHLRRGNLRTYMKVASRRREDISGVFKHNRELFRREGLVVEPITREDYNLGYTLASLPGIGSGIELSLIE